MRLRRVQLLALLVLPALASLQAAAPLLSRADTPKPRKPGVVSFLAFGDSGTGGSGQRKVAESMAKVIEASPVDFALMLGDNFYPDGLASASDPLFDTLFRDAYPKEKFPFPFFVTLGNHEYLKNAAANLKVGARDSRWQMPARRYAFTAPLSDRESIFFLCLDTTPIDSPARVTPDADVRPPLESLAEELAGASGARWRFVYGHHAFLTSGVHGESEPMLKQVAPILAAGKTDAYFCGHDHILESMSPVAGVPEIVSGGGGGWDRASPIVHVRKESLFRQTGGGFVRAEIRPDTATFVFFDVDGVARHTRTLFPRPKGEGTR